MEDLEKMVRALSSENRAILIKFLRALEKQPEPEHISLGKPFDMKPKDERGRLLTEEEIWDREHPLIRKPYGYYESSQDITGKNTRKVWTRKEIDAHNQPIEEAWLAEKRKYFPDATLPPNTGSAPESRFSDPRYTHPTMNGY